jgi:hypothetical protein
MAALSTLGAKFRPMYDPDMAFSTSLLMLLNVTGSLSSTPAPLASNGEYRTEPKLANPKFNILRPVDILLSARIFGKLTQPRHVIRTYNSPTAVETVLVWVLTGQIE